MARTLEKHFNPYQQAKFPAENFFLIHDNARPHTYGPCKEFLNQNYAKNLFPHPSKSPDLNPIEKIWGILKDDEYGRDTIVYQNRKALKKSIATAWQKLSMDHIFLHINDLFDSRIKKVIETNGALIK